MGEVLRTYCLLQASSLVLLPVSFPDLLFLPANFQDKGGDIRDLWGEHECALKDLKGPCRESHLSADMVEKLGEHECTPKDIKDITGDMVGKLVNHLVPSLRGGDRFFAPAFLDAYRSFTTTKHVVDLLLKRYADFCPDCKEDEQVKSILCSFLDTWIDKYPEEFCQTSDLSILRKLKAYLSVNMPYSDLNFRVHNLLMELQQESNESEREDEEDSDLGSHISGDSKIDLWVSSVKLQLTSDYAPVTESPKSTRIFCYWNQM
ncbi:uncharacterized protein LOC117713419 [Arvicanthis niloticus]|uniref:uncharacterized protein LOC117713419 n=1 Tax=Arvicanthis niloticus TaxID=61156 RepID=UPI001487561C|nr:uncharacterized protein LOC117713419 [Arvicanthis niloticus]